MKFYSQFEQDKFVYENFFINKNKGYFVDIGAHDGVTFSNSKFFEELEWDGVCIEPNPKVFSILDVRSMPDILALENFSTKRFRKTE